MKVKTAALLAQLLLVAGCSSPSLQSDLTSSSGQQPPKSDYESIVAAHTRHAQAYSGFYNLFELDVTMLNSLVRSALIDKSAEFLQWDAEQARKEREKMFQEMSNEASYVISFYAPERRHNDLDRVDSMWKVYLEANGTRYQGKVKKNKSNLVQIQALYPHFTRFSTAYTVTFPVAMTTIEKQPTKIIITSTQGTANLDFALVP